MPHTTSAVNRAVDSRVTYTGEPRRLARRCLADLNTVPTTRHRPIAAAINLQQQDFEAAVLLAASEASRSLYNQHVPAYPLRYITPKPDHLELAPLPHALGPLAFGLIPRRYDDDIMGTPGLRAHTGRRGVSLSQLDIHGQQTAASVLLKGVRRDEWTNAVEWANDQCLDPRSRTSFVHEQALSPAERRFMRSYPSFGGHPMLASSMLRRLNILSAACWVHVWTADSTIKIEWCHGPSLRVAAHMLTNPYLGILGPEITLPQADRLDSDDKISSVTFQGPPLPAHCINRRRRAFPAGALLLRRQTSSHVFISQLLESGLSDAPKADGEVGLVSRRG